MKTGTHRSGNSKNTAASFCIASSVGAGLGFLLCAGLLMLIAVFCSSNQLLPYGVLGILTLLTAIAGSFFGGFISARILGRMGLLAGLSSAVLFLAVMLAVSFCFPQETISWAAAAGKVGAILLSGTLGGIAATGKRQKIRKRL